MLSPRPLMVRLAAVLAALTMTGCGAVVPPGSEHAGPQYGGSLTVGLEASWVSLDPLRATSYNSFSVLLTMYEPLFDLTAEGELVPQLARDYEVSDDGLTYTVELQEGVEFQDGAEFDADAVVTNMERMRDPENGCSCLADLAVLDSVRTVDDSTVEFTLNRPNAGFPTLVLAAAPGLMASPEAIGETDGELDKNPVGTGPFILDQEIPGSSVRVEKWDGYRDPERPYLSSVEFQIISDSDSRYSSLVSTSVDVADNVSVESLNDAEIDPSVRIDPQGAAGSIYVMFQTGEGSPLSDVRARQAACSAIDPGLMSDALYDGARLTGQESPFPVGSPWAMGEVAGYPSYDPERARELVDELGGLEFDLRITSTPENTRVAQALEAQWEYVGIDATIRPTDQATLVEDSHAHDFDAMVHRWRGSMDPDGNTARWFDSSIATPDTPSTNYNLVDDPELDSLMASAAAELDPEERFEAYRAVSEKLAEISPYCYLWGADWIRMSLTNVHDIPNRPDNFMQLRDAYVAQ